MCHNSRIEQAEYRPTAAEGLSQVSLGSNPNTAMARLKVYNVSRLERS